MKYNSSLLTIDEVCSITDCQHKTAPTLDYPTEYRMLRTVNIRNGQLRDIDSTKSVSKEIYDQWSVRGHLEPGDVILTREAPMGEVALLRGNEKYNFFLGQRILQLKAFPDVILPEFLYYSLQTKELRHQIMMNEGTGSVVSNLRIPLLKKIKILVPPLSQQKNQTKILIDIDDKILLNKKIISKLESIAQTLFKRWFIDFEFPNEEGQPYKTSGGKMIESEIGLIPAKWSIVKLSNVTTLLKKTFNPLKTDLTKVMHFSLPAYDKNQQPTLDDVLNIKSNKWLIEDNCVIFSKMNPRTPRVWLTTTNEQFHSVASSEFVVLKNKSEETSSFIYNICKSEVFNDYLIRHATGSTNSRQRVTPTVALQFAMALNDNIVKDYSKKTVGMTETIKLLNKENAHLQQIRNILLPKLMTGEVETIDEVEA